VKRGKTTDFVFFEVQAAFPPVGTHEPHQTRRKGVFGCLTTSHQISNQHIDRNIVLMKKIKKSARLLSQFFGLFLAITPQPLSLAGL